MMLKSSTNDLVNHRNMRSVLMIVLWMCVTPAVGGADVMTPETLLRQVYEQNPDLMSLQSEVEAEKAAIPARYAPPNPRFGFMRESNMNFMQQQTGAMNSWMISQEILFPTKHFVLGSIQALRSRAYQHKYLDRRLEIRKVSLSAYFSHVTAHSILSLLGAQKETLKEIARVVESRRSVGEVSQQDEMKIHMEQTALEQSLLLQRHEVVATRSELNGLLNRPPETNIELPKMDVQRPRLIDSLELKEIPNLDRSNLLKEQELAVEQSRKAKSMAKQGYLPDFMLIYRRALGGQAMDDAQAFAVEMTVPLWFFTKQRSEVSSASAKALADERRLEHLRRATESQVKTLQSKVTTLSSLLAIYETALIPQARMTLNASNSAYASGRIGFQDLLDSERSLYSIRIESYRRLTDWVEAVTELERLIAFPISALPFDGGGA